MVQSFSCVRLFVTLPQLEMYLLTIHMATPSWLWRTGSHPPFKYVLLSLLWKTATTTSILFSIIVFPFSLLPEHILKSFAVYFYTLLECKPCKYKYFHLACHKCIPHTLAATVPQPPSQGAGPQGASRFSPKPWILSFLLWVRVPGQSSLLI